MEERSFTRTVIAKGHSYCQKEGENGTKKGMFSFFLLLNLFKAEPSRKLPGQGNLGAAICRGQLLCIHKQRIDHRGKWREMVNT